MWKDERKFLHQKLIKLGMKKFGSGRVQMESKIIVSIYKNYVYCRLFELNLDCISHNRHINKYPYICFSDGSSTFPSESCEGKWAPHQHRQIPHSHVDECHHVISDVSEIRCLGSHFHQT